MGAGGRGSFHLADKGPTRDTDSPAGIGTVTEQCLLSPSESQAQTASHAQPSCFCSATTRQRCSPASHCLQGYGAVCRWLPVIPLRPPWCALIDRLHHARAAAAVA